MNPIYLDNQATTPVDHRVMSEMYRVSTEIFGNPHSDGHLYGWAAHECVRDSRRQVADAIGADEQEIIFLSGATESCNLAIRGSFRAAASRGRKRIVTLATEHSAVAETCLDLSKEGADVVVLPVDNTGLVDLDLLESVVDEETLLVSIMLANNEIGVIQPLTEIARIAKRYGALVHTDATQGVGKIPVDVQHLGIDLLSFSAHKIYGPKGIGCLYVHEDAKKSITPILTGGGQEMGLRSGTVATPLVAGFAEACRIVNTYLDEDATRIARLTERLKDALFQCCPAAVLLGHPNIRVPGNLNIAFPGWSGDGIVQTLSEKVAISTGAACWSRRAEPSRVLQALGVDPEIAISAVRISVGRLNTDNDIDIAVESFSALFGSAKRGQLNGAA